jgi:hypothetical protein
MLGKMVGISVGETPNQRASVAAYWSTAVEGSKRPWPTWSSELNDTRGAVP